jgi:hypothetical protein
MALFMHFPSKAKILMIAGLNHADLTRGHSSFFGISVRRGKAEKVPGSVSWCNLLSRPLCVLLRNTSDHVGLMKERLSRRVHI